MSRKPLDVRKECVRLNVKGKPKPTEQNLVGYYIRSCLPTNTLLRGSRQVEREINSRIIVLKKNLYIKIIFHKICYMLEKLAQQKTY